VGVGQRSRRAERPGKYRDSSTHPARIDPPKNPPARLKLAAGNPDN